MGLHEPDRRRGHTDAFCHGEVDSVTLDSTASRGGGWMDYGGLFKNQGQCMRLAH